MSDKPIIVWFRQDLRLTDHPALARAIETGRPVVPVYILDDTGPGQWALGAASRWWLHHSLLELAADIERRGARLVLRTGAARAVIPALCAEVGAEAVHVSRMYEPWAAALERDLKADLEPAGVALRRFPGSLLREPEEIATQSGGPYKVYTPFWRALRDLGVPRPPVAASAHIASPARAVGSDDLAAWGLLPTRPDWAGGLRDAWVPGEAGARKRLTTFIASALKGYKEDRNRPDLPATSRLSPHLHFGELSPSTIWHAVASAAGGSGKLDADSEHFLKELVWREFSAHLLFHFPDLPDSPFRPEFAAFPWREDASGLAAWQKGRTGYPIVDAGMRELWHTGYMHNRVRMIVGSFLVKDLLVPWQQGEAWFWDTLVDADLANNAASWQWIAGSGADAAPYFRVFNPVLQGQKFDPEGTYVRRWVPELGKLPAGDIHAPWQAAAATLQAAGVVLGQTYPHPILDHAMARDRALSHYEAVKVKA
ncbi:MAG: deoxyribodipyrimidine photo-lyase [Hyphomicrobiaceae bacterium]|nr:deoxyribodipyrimidine photo-lyase [Hyphomicrobiaceae bacterium]